MWDCESHVSTVRLDEYPIRRCIHEQEKLQRDEDQGELNLDSTQRPLQGAFLIPPVLPVVLICRRNAPPDHRDFHGVVHDEATDHRVNEYREQLVERKRSEVRETNER